MNSDIMTAADAGVTDEQFERAKQAAADRVKRAFAEGGDLPPVAPSRLSEACQIVIDGAANASSPVQQRCCRVAATAAEEPAEEEVGEGGGRRVDERGTGNETEPQSPQVACLPTFVIAGTQKSGTTALAGKGKGKGKRLTKCYLTAPLT